MIKDIIKNLKSSSTLRINEISKKLESDGKKIYKFGFGQSPFQVPIDVIDELKNNAYQNKYLPMQGLNELRNAISKYASSQNNNNYKEENVIIGPGTKELMFNVKDEKGGYAESRMFYLHVYDTEEFYIQDYIIQNQLQVFSLFLGEVAE